MADAAWRGGEGKGGEESSGEGKGGEKSRGGKRGKGSKPRTPGTVRFLTSHRNMLTREAKRTNIKLEQAESAYQQACRDFEQAPTQNNLSRFRRGTDWVRYRSDDVVVVALKWRRLDDNITSTY